MEQVGEPKVPPAAAPSHLRWDTSDLVSHDCTLATANAADGKVILSFGAKLGHNGPDVTQGGEISVNLLQSIALRPLTAKRLLEMLERLIAERDARGRSSHSNN